MNKYFTFKKSVRMLCVLGLLIPGFGASAQLFLINENFSTATGTTPPTGWSQNLIAGNAVDTWRFNNPGGRFAGSPMQAPFAIFDSDDYSDDFTAENAALESPAVNTTGYTVIKLKWDQYFESGFGGAANVEVYNGTSWVSVYSNNNTTTANPNTQDIDVSTHAANRTGVRVRLRWTGDYSWYWIVDNVQLYAVLPDVQATAILSPTLCGGTAETVTVRVRNNGPIAASNIPVVVNITGSITTTVNGTLTRSIAALGGTDTINIPVPLNTTGGVSVKAYTNLGSDAVRSNDTTYFTGIGTPSVPVGPASANRCGVGTVALTATPGSVTDSIAWYSAPIGGTVLGRGTSFTTPILPIGTTNYYAEAQRFTPSSLSTIFTGGNGNAGTQFNVTPSMNVRIDSFGVRFSNFTTTGTFNVRVYYRVGGYAGFENNTGAWTLLGNDPNVVVTSLPSTVNAKPGVLNLQAGVTYGIYVVLTAGPGLTLDYTSTTGTYTNADLSITTGVGIGGLFAGINPGRTWNGTLFYAKSCNSARDTIPVNANPLPSTSMSQGATFQGTYAAGSLLNPDHTKGGNQIVYEIPAPQGYTNADYGTIWTIVSNSIQTAAGTNISGYSFAAPAGANNAKMTVNASSTQTDSTFIASCTIRFIGTNCDTVIRRNLFIAPVPVAKFGNSIACFGSSTMFTDSSTQSSGTRSYRWDFGDAGSADTSIETNPSYQYSAPGTYTVTQTVISNLGYSNVFTKVITVGYLPVVKFSVANKCDGDAVEFTNNTTIPGPTVGLSSSWDFGNGQNSTATSPSHLYAAVGVYDVTLTVTSSLGCVSKLTRPASVFPMPVADFTAPNVCKGNPTQFTNTSTVTSGNLGQDWMFGDGGSSSNVNPTYVYDSSAVFNVRLVAYTAFGCKDTMDKQVSVFSVPDADFTVSGNCASDSISFNNTSSSSLTYTSEWNFGNSVTQTNNASTVRFKYFAPGGYNVTLKVTAGGCSDTKTMPVVVDEVPTVSFSANGNVCKNTASEFTNLSSISSGSLSYAWNFGDGNTSTDKDPSKTYASDGSFNVWLKATSGKGCADSVKQVVTVFALPNASFDTNYNYSIMRQVAFVPANTTYYGYEWDLGDGTMTQQASPVHSYLSNGPFQVKLKVTDQNGCMSTSSNIPVGFNVSSGRVNQSAFTFNAYPSPFKGSTNLSYELEKSGVVVVKVYDILGKELTTLVNGKQEKGSYKVELNTAALGASSNMYIIQMSLDGNTVSKQVVEIK